MSKVSTEIVETKAYQDQRPGTSGLRKKVKVFMEGNYTHNFVQAMLSTIPESDMTKGKSTLVLGGDGRYFVKECVSIIVRLAAANGISKIIVGTNGILSTPAGSNLIRKRQATGGILLTASHNPGGPTADFGIKYNMSNGGPAPEKITEAVFACSKSLTSYKIVKDGELEFDLSTPGITEFVVDGDFKFAVEVVDSVKDYVELMKKIFDFESIKKFISLNKEAKFRFDALNGVTGPYMKAIFVDELGLPESSLRNVIPKPDFGGLHPDPNLTYAADLVKEVDQVEAIFGAASDGDGDRNMIVGYKTFVNPCDSVAIIAEYATEAIPFFTKKGGLSGVARSMPTSSALDRVAQGLGIKSYEVPTGWKFFGNLMDAGLCSLCGEESFGTGSDHVREKDGLWAVLAWLSIVSYKSLKANKLVSLHEILQEHYSKFGRSYFARYDYEEVDAKKAAQVVETLSNFIEDSSNVGKEIKVDNEVFKISKLVDFTYVDPVDASVSKKQGLSVIMEGGTRIVLRASGTGSASTTSTLRVYLERVVDKTGNTNDDKDKVMALASQLAEQLTKMAEITGRTKPNVVT